MGVRRWLAVSFVAFFLVAVMNADAEPRAAPQPANTEILSVPVPLPVVAPVPDLPFDIAIPSLIADAPSSPCPGDMVLVEGDYCPHPKHVCLKWMDPPSSPYADFRCAEYRQPATCDSPTREAKRFCIDREEYVRDAEPLPLADQSWTSASKICADEGRRLCLESEWNFACEGEEMRPYPYGFTRDASLCNIDRRHLGRPQEGLADLRAPISAYPDCLSPFGVHDMSGNVEEWATLDHGKAPNRSAMKGAWWLPGKNTCRAATLGHGERYRGPQVGVRCCKDAT